MRGSKGEAMQSLGELWTSESGAYLILAMAPHHGWMWIWKSIWLYTPNSWTQKGVLSNWSEIDSFFYTQFLLCFLICCVSFNKPIICSSFICGWVYGLPKSEAGCKTLMQNRRWVRKASDGRLNHVFIITKSICTRGLREIHLLNPESIVKPPYPAIHKDGAYHSHLWLLPLIPCSWLCNGCGEGGSGDAPTCLLSCWSSSGTWRSEQSHPSSTS